MVERNNVLVECESATAEIPRTLEPAAVDGVPTTSVSGSVTERQDPSAAVLQRPGAFRLQAVDLAIPVLLVPAIAIWWISLRNLPLHAMTDVGLPSVLPPATWIAAMLVFVAFVLAVRSGRTGSILLSLVATVVVLHGLGIMAEPSMRFAVGYRHIGIAEYFLRRGTVDPTLDAYQSWPGFFALTAFIWKATGISDPVPFVTWTPILYNLLYIGPLVAIGDKLIGHRTTVWIAAWLFTVSNWIGQDYFSPQGWYLLSYMLILAIVLRWFKDPSHQQSTSRRSVPVLGRLTRWMDQARSSGTLSPDDPSTHRQRAFLLLVIVVIAASIVAGHQLTPFAVVFGVGALSMIGWSRLRLLPVVILLGMVLWLGYFAAGYLSGHGDGLLGQAGALGSIFGQTVTERLTGTPGHTFIVQLRLLQTAATWLLAAVGILRLLRNGRQRTAFGLAVAAAATVPVMGLQSYGGEALLRIALFALPFVSLLCAVAVVGIASHPITRKQLGVLGAAGVVLTLVFPFTRYGNEKMDWYSLAEVGAVRQMYSIVPEGSVLVSITGDLPWMYTGYADFDYRLLTDDDPVTDEALDADQPSPAGLVEQTVKRMAHKPGQRSFLIASRSQEGALELKGTKPGTYEVLLEALDQSKEFRTVISNPDARVYEYVGPAPA